MKNITLSVDDETYRAARIVAAERDRSVSALVRDYLQSLANARGSKDAASAALFAALDKADGFSAADRLSREEAHARRSA
jgi:plasmid stability protein